MPCRYLSEKQLAFTVPGRPLCQGALNGKQGGGPEAYKAVVRLACKYAMAAQNWQYAKDEPLYLVLTVCVGTANARTKQTAQQMLKGEVLATRRPNVTRIGKVVVEALKGLAFANERQIVALLVVKRHTKQERIEVLLGVPKDFRELTYDIRNA